MENTTAHIAILDNYFSAPISANKLTEGGVIRIAIAAAKSDPERYSFFLSKPQPKNGVPPLLLAIIAIEDVLDEEFDLRFEPDEALKIAALLKIGGWLQ